MSLLRPLILMLPIGCLLSLPALQQGRLTERTLDRGWLKVVRPCVLSLNELHHCLPEALAWLQQDQHRPQDWQLTAQLAQQQLQRQHLLDCLCLLLLQEKPHPLMQVLRCLTVQQQHLPYAQLQLQRQYYAAAGSC
jgi:hypothetical protein